MNSIIEAIEKEVKRLMSTSNRFGGKRQETYETALKEVLRFIEPLKNQELTNQQYHFNHGKTHGFEQAKSVYDPQVNLLQNILKLTNEFNQQNPPLT
jgi:hypothetical protein